MRADFILRSLLIKISFKFLLVLLVIQIVESSPQQFFGQTFSQSSFVGPSGQVVSSSIYVDSDGNRVINGVPVSQQKPQTYQQQPAPVQQQAPRQPAPVQQQASRQPAQAPAAKPSQPQPSAPRPQSSSGGSGAYKPDANGW